MGSGVIIRGHLRSQVGFVACIASFSLWRLFDEPRARRLPSTINLPDKDVPILMAALDATADYLLTGDKEHFGPYFGKVVEGITILRPRDYPALRERGSLLE